VGRERSSAIHRHRPVLAVVWCAITLVVIAIDRISFV
jgi:hypothetical protein